MLRHVLVLIKQRSDRERQIVDEQGAQQIRHGRALALGLALVQQQPQQPADQVPGVVVPVPLVGAAAFERLLASV